MKFIKVVESSLVFFIGILHAQASLEMYVCEIFLLNNHFYTQYVQYFKNFMNSFFLEKHIWWLSNMYCLDYWNGYLPVVGWDNMLFYPNQFLTYKCHIWW